jgi:hypothetical protein
MTSAAHAALVRDPKTDIVKCRAAARSGGTCAPLANANCGPNDLRSHDWALGGGSGKPLPVESPKAGGGVGSGERT